MKGLTADTSNSYDELRFDTFDDCLDFCSQDKDCISFVYDSKARDINCSLFKKKGFELAKELEAEGHIAGWCPKGNTR